MKQELCNEKLHPDAQGTENTRIIFTFPKFAKAQKLVKYKGWIQSSGNTVVT
jgi:hypothetical protein